MARTKTATGRTDAQLLGAMASDDYGVYSAATQELEAWFAAHPTEALARAIRVGELALTAKHAASRSKAGYTVLPLVVAALGEGEHLPVCWDPLVSTFGGADYVRRLFERIPARRRKVIVDRELAKGEPGVAGYVASALLDLVPDAARILLDNAAKQGRLGDKVLWNALALWRGSVPRIDAIARPYEARLANEPPPPPKPAGTLAFHAPVTIAPEDYPALDATGKAQYRAAATAYLGEPDVRDGKQFVKRLEAEDLDASDATMRRWSVTRDGAHLYDFWVVWVDNGTVFHAGTSRLAMVHQVQGSFQALDGKRASRELAVDFDRSAPSDLWSRIAKRVSRPSGELRDRASRARSPRRPR